MRILVTGATGFVASHLLPALAADGHDVVAVARDVSRVPSIAGVEPLEVDLRAPDLGAQLPPADAVVHLAQGNAPFPDGAPVLFGVNTAATVQLLEHARRAGAQAFVYASSASVYGFADEPLHEDDATKGADFYAATKIAGERFVAAYAALFATSSLRLVAPYGPGQTDRMIPRLVENVRAGRPIMLNSGGRPRMNPVFIDDAVDAVRVLLTAGGSTVLNVAGDDAVSIRELGELIGEVVGAEPVFELGSGQVGGDLVCDNSRLKELLGRERLVSLRDGLSRLVSVSAAA